MRNIDRYIKDTQKHIPGKYAFGSAEFMDVMGESNMSYENIKRIWFFGFESAYRAAKAGQLDFQQGQKEPQKEGCRK
ncbi:MAG: hypothetical protein ACLR6B_07855 [Blautia sp.]